MKINAIEIINVLIVVFLFFLLKRKRDVTTLLLVLFVYGTLHFSYSVVALGANDVTKLLVLLHIEGSGVLATLSTLILLGVSSVLLSRRAYGAFVVSSREERQIAINILLIMAVILGGYIFNTRPDDWLQLKNVISIEVMLALLLIGFFGLIGSRAVHVEAFYSWGVGGLFILGFSNLISLYEVLSKDSWAGTLESSGAMVYRASSILFNPNLYGFWASLMYLGWAYGLHQYTSRWKMMVSGMILASVSIYLSGARSAGFLLLAVLILSSLLWKGRLRWIPVVLLPLTWSTLYVGAKSIVAVTNSNDEGLRSTVLLGARFMDAPIYLFNYILRLGEIPSGILGGVLTKFQNTLRGILGDVPPEIMESIDGRFVGVGRDSGWLVLYQDVGWFAMSVVLLSCCMLFVRGIRTYIENPCPSSVYACALLCYCAFSGLVMRFQVFPAWLFIGLVLIPCLVFWRRIARS